MVLIIVLILLEILTVLVLRDHFYRSSRLRFWLSSGVNFLLSIWLWFVIISSLFFKGPFDTPSNIWMHLNMSGMIVAVGIPRMLLCLNHYSGKLLRIRKGGHLRRLTGTWLIISVMFISVIALGTFIGKYNFRTEEITIKIKGLDERLDSLRIVQVSDLHLGGFYRHPEKLIKIIDEVNRLEPDLIVNTGDFISYGWREFDRYDTILSKAESRYGNFAIPGNHDMGTYYPGSSEEEKKAITMKVNDLAAASGYDVLNNESIILNIKGAEIALIGVETSGRHGDIIHSDIGRAASGTDSVDFRILLAHDPDQWRMDVTGKTDIKLTLAGHTHGMQVGIITKKFRWSPAKYFYPEWGGLYSYGEQYLYVNRGLGVMGIPFRIWMPPEITLLTIVPE
jgi:predicted MPP superfamily phosphohydrolase